jgi:hypothetical protein
MHAFRSSTRRLQRLVWLTLLAWSFALASGVVNACVLGLPGRAGEGPSPPAHGKVASHGGPSGAFGIHGAEDHETAPSSPHLHEQGPGSPGKDSCLKFCGDESSALTKSTLFAADMVAALVDARAQRRLAVPAVQVNSSSSLEQPRAQGPPLVIRFLRLTL